MKEVKSETKNNSKKIVIKPNVKYRSYGDIYIDMLDDINDDTLAQWELDIKNKKLVEACKLDKANLKYYIDHPNFYDVKLWREESYKKIYEVYIHDNRSLLNVRLSDTSKFEFELENGKTHGTNYAWAIVEDNIESSTFIGKIKELDHMIMGLQRLKSAANKRIISIEVDE